MPFCSGFSAAMIHLRQDVETVVLKRLIGTEIRRVESRMLASCGQKNGPKVVPARILGDARMDALLAALDVPAQRSRTARLDCRHDADLA